MVIEDITIVSYLVEKHKDWLPHWCKQLNKQTARGFKVMLIFHNWSTTSALNGPSTLVRELLDDDIPIVFYDFCSSSNIGAVIDFGISKVDTTYLAHWDVDDDFHPERLKRQIAFLREHPEVDFLGTRQRGFVGKQPPTAMLNPLWIEPNETTAALATHDELYKCLMRDGENCLGHSSMIYKIEAMKKIGGFSHLDVMTDPQHRSPDFETWKKAMMAGFKFHRLPELLVYWRLDSSAIRDVSNVRIQE